jgi:hypothetical protein
MDGVDSFSAARQFLLGVIEGIQKDDVAAGRPDVDRVASGPAEGHLAGGKGLLHFRFSGRWPRIRRDCRWRLESDSQQG